MLHRYRLMVCTIMTSPCYANFPLIHVKSVMVHVNTYTVYVVWGTLGHLKYSIVPTRTNPRPHDLHVQQHNREKCENSSSLPLPPPPQSPRGPGRCITQPIYHSLALIECRVWAICKLLCFPLTIILLPLCRGIYFVADKMQLDNMVFCVQKEW